jgi:predicted nucleic acid-binding protein
LLGVVYAAFNKEPDLPRITHVPHWRLTIATAPVLIGGILILELLSSPLSSSVLAGNTNTSTSDRTSPPQNPATADTNQPTMEVAQSVMVTVELDFGSHSPSIADALREIERHYQPDDGVGGTFSILEAYGEPTTDGKLHISMHISSEKPGLAALVFRRTGASLWKTRIVAATHPPSSSFAGKDLSIMVDDGHGKPHLLDGSKNPTSILDAIVRDLEVPLRDFWPDGEEREVSFFHSACGCPVKVRMRRQGEKTVRTKEQPVIFPDDPAVAATIGRLMGW